MLKLKQEIEEKYKFAADILLKKIQTIPDIAIIAGSGVSEAFHNQHFCVNIDYSEIPILPKTSVKGHSGNISLTEIKGKKVLVFFGRFHLYEGRTVEETLSLVLLINALGIKKVIITNAAGGLNNLYQVGDLMLINDTINHSNKSLLNLFLNNKILLHDRTIENEWYFKVKKNMIENGQKFQNGTYVMVAGPSYETRAEIKMFKKIGGDAVGMSTVLELILANILGLETLGCSVITNLAKEISSNSVCHQEVLEVAELSKSRIKKFIEISVECS